MNDTQAPETLSLRDSLATLVKVIWSFTFGALHDFVWADLREGLIRLRGLGWTTRALILGGFSLLALGIDIANFARQAATWGTEFVTLRLPRAVTWVALAGVVVLRVWDVVEDAIGRVQANGLGVDGCAVWICGVVAGAR